jgi:hypothetical protein
LDLYAKAVTQTKRQAQQKIVNQLLAAQQRTPKQPIPNALEWRNEVLWVAFSKAL